MKPMSQSIAHLHQIELAFRWLQGHENIACLDDGAGIDAKGMQLDTAAAHHVAYRLST